MIKEETTIKIPVYPHLKRFIMMHWYHDHRNGEPLRIEEDSVLGKMIMAILISKRSIRKASGLMRYEFTDYIEVDLSNNFKRRSPAIHKLCLINLDLLHIFHSHLFGWVRAQKVVGVSAKRACESFIAFYQLQDHYSFDAAHRAWNRYINSEYQKERLARSLNRKNKNSVHLPS